MNDLQIQTEIEAHRLTGTRQPGLWPRLLADGDDATLSAVLDEVLESGLHGDVRLLLKNPSPGRARLAEALIPAFTRRPIGDTFTWRTLALLTVNLPDPECPLRAEKMLLRLTEVLNASDLNEAEETLSTLIKSIDWPENLNSFMATLNATGEIARPRKNRTMPTEKRRKIIKTLLIMPLRGFTDEELRGAQEGLWTLIETLKLSKNRLTLIGVIATTPDDSSVHQHAQNILNTLRKERRHP